MSEASCHYNHNRFFPGQRCIHCSYQEPHLDDYKSDVKRELEKLLDRFANVTQDGKFKMVFIDSEELDNLKMGLYNSDVIDFINEFTELLNPNLKKNENLRN